MADEQWDPITTGDEAHERDLNRHRAEEQRTVRAEMVARLHGRGIEVPDDASLEEVVRTLDQVEAAERDIQARGGDLMIESPKPLRGD
ncbi:MAG TPA: hypothetical protein VH277_10805 [Gemmatimonadaceae bacterium]|jgi:hypothetical protein|nr:hypothetical protein [Gemmatimonadaceae bacterium]